MGRCTQIPWVVMIGKIMGLMGKYSPDKRGAEGSYLGKEPDCRKLA